MWRNLTNCDSIYLIFIFRTNEMDKRIIIIGAGASGIAAATRLLFAGFKHVLVLDAENRLGGRICTVPFGKNVLDMGAQWWVDGNRILFCISYRQFLFPLCRCHGEQDNVVFELAKNENLLSSNTNRYRMFQLIRSDGFIVPEQLSNKLNSLAVEIIETGEDEKLLYNGSLGNYFTEKWVTWYKRCLKRSVFLW